MNLCEQYFINFRKHCQYIWCWIKCFKMKTSLSIKMKFAKQTWQISFLLLFLLSSKIYYTFQYPMKFHLKYTREHRCSWNVFKNALIASQPFSTINTLQGRIQDFKLGGGALKKIAPSRGRREHFRGNSCEKSLFYAKKSVFTITEGGAKNVGVFRVKNHDFTPKKTYFPPILGGGGGRAPGAPPPPGSAPALYSLCNVLVPKQCLLSYIWLGHGVKIKPERNCALRATREATIVII